MGGIVITFTTTAMPRPGIIEATYKSFSENIKDLDLKTAKLLVNIDPVSSGDLEADIEGTKAVAQRYFGEVVVNVPEKPNFTAAVDWCWTTADTEFVFHLEDDWELRRPINVGKIIAKMRQEGYMQAILRAYSSTYNKLALSPGIMHRDYYSRFAGNFDYELNPEIQLRKPFVKKNEIFVVGGNPIVADLGRQWLKRQPFKKPDKKGNFTEWEKDA